MTLLGDTPGTDPASDRLGYAGLAKAIHHGITNMAPTDPLVVAVYGPWGAGKSTLINYIKHFNENEPETKRLSLLEFNPWWFAGHEDLAKQFLDRFASFLDSGSGELKKAGAVLKALADIVAESPSINIGIPGVTVSSKEIAKSVGGKLGKSDSVPKLKERISEKITLSGERILVLIDDIDRLSSDEIRQLFRVVKALADFQNVVYLLAFDRDVVDSALDSLQEGFGSKYLEKIIHVPFELPSPDKAGLQDMLFERLNLVTGGYPEEIVDQTYFGNVFLSGLNRCVTTPRDVVRVTNSIAVTFPSVRSEVNTVDFIAIEFIRVFMPDLYKVIRQNPDKFAGHYSSSEKRSSDNLTSFHNSWLNQLKPNEAAIAKDLLPRIFPKLEGVWSGTIYGAEFAQQWQRALRVCSRERIHVYFRFSLFKGDISQDEVQSVLAVASDSDAFASKIVEFSKQKTPSGRSRAPQLLEELWLHLDGISDRDIASVVGALINIGDLLSRPEDEPRLPLEVDNRLRVSRAISKLLERMDKKKRAGILSSPMRKKSAPGLICSLCLLLSQQHGKGGTSASHVNDQLVSLKDAKQLSSIGIEIVKDLASAGRLLTHPEMPRMLNLCKSWISKAEYNKLVSKLFDDDQNLIRVLERFSGVALVSTIGDKVSKRVPHLGMEALANLFNMNDLERKAKAIAGHPSLSASEQELINRFLVELSKRKPNKTTRGSRKSTMHSEEDDDDW